MTKRKQQTYRKKADREIKGRELRDHRGIIFASLYTIIKNKMGDIFLSRQNQCHITGVKKSYFCLTFHLRPKKVFWWVVGGWTHRHRNGHRLTLKSLFTHPPATRKLFLISNERYGKNKTGIR